MTLLVIITWALGTIVHGYARVLQIREDPIGEMPGGGWPIVWILAALWPFGVVLTAIVIIIVMMIVVLEQVD